MSALRGIAFLLAMSLAMFLAMFLAMPSAAKADLRLCNTTKLRVSVALAYMGESDWTSEGWWTVNASSCETVLSGALNSEFYYIYAIDERGGEWVGNVYMCTSEHEFKIVGRSDCFSRGYDRTGFFEVDTGKDSQNWTLQLTDQAR